MKTYTSFLNDIPRVINNTNPDNQTWAVEVINDSLRYLTTKYYFNERSYTVPGGTVAQQQFYNLPPQVKKVINVTINIGNILWQPKEVASRTDWDSLNVIPALYQDYPSYFYVFNGQVGIFPTPSSSSNTITINYKTRIEDLTQADVTSGTVTITNSSVNVVGTGTSFAQWMAGNWLRVSHSSTDAQNGDNQWYQINTVTDSTHLAFKNIYSGATVTGGSYTIGQVPLLPEDYQDLPLYRLGVIYYTTRFPDPARAQIYQSLWDRGIAALDEEFGSKSTNVALPDIESQVINPNLFTRNIG